MPAANSPPNPATSGPGDAADGGGRAGSESFRAEEGRLGQDCGDVPWAEHAACSTPAKAVFSAPGSRNVARTAACTASTAFVDAPARVLRDVSSTTSISSSTRLGCSTRRAGSAE